MLTYNMLRICVTGFARKGLIHAQLQHTDFAIVCTIDTYIIKQSICICACIVANSSPVCFS